MQGRISRGILFPACLSMIGAITAVSVYNFWRIDRVQVNVESVNQFYVPVLKHLNLFSGKWSAYQRLFEQGVGFRRWGRGHHERVASKLRLKKMVEPNLGELKHRLEMIPANRMLAESASLRALLGHLESLASQEAGTLAEINGLVNARHLDEAAAAYAKARSEHLLLSQELFDVMHACEARLQDLQLSTEEELRGSQSMMLLLLAMSVVFSFFVLLQLRRWLKPMLEWTRVAQEIALKGIHRDVKFPQITRSMPPEISLLTREFTRMGMTVLERERTIHQQKDKLESLNSHLKEQNEMFRKLGGLNERVLNCMSSGLLVSGEQGTVEQFNERFCELFGIERNKVFGRVAADVLAAWPEESVRKWLGATEVLRESRVELGSRVFEVRITPLQTHRGVLLLFEEISHLVEAEEKLEHARKLVLAGNLSAQVAHEVRNPLNSMSLQLEMLEEDLAAAEATPVSALARLKALEEQVQRLDRITRKYLDVQRPSANARQQVDLNALIEKCIAFLSGEIQAAQVRVALEFGALEPIIAADPDALSQVLFNLVRNAIEALREVPVRKLTVATFERGGDLHIQVRDSGPGIRREVRTRLFEPFVSDKASGTGLGLSLSRQICIEHGGELKLVDGTFEETAFEITLPKGNELASNLDR